MYLWPYFWVWSSNWNLIQLSKILLICPNLTLFWPFFQAYVPTSSWHYSSASAAIWLVNFYYLRSGEWANTQSADTIFSIVHVYELNCLKSRHQHVSFKIDGRKGRKSKVASKNLWYLPENLKVWLGTYFFPEILSN